MYKIEERGSLQKLEIFSNLYFSYIRYKATLSDRL